MTPNLRRTHRATWLALAIALPVGFGAALYLTRQPITQEPVSAPLPAVLPVLVRSAASQELTISLRQAAQVPDFQLDILVKTALEIPSAVVRVRQKTGWQPIGLLNAPGLYRFSLPGSDAHPRIDLFDDIHQRTLYTFQL